VYGISLDDDKRRGEKEEDPQDFHGCSFLKVAYDLKGNGSEKLQTGTGNPCQ